MTMRRAVVFWAVPIWAVLGTLALCSPAAGLAREDVPGVPTAGDTPRTVVPTSVLLVADETGASAALHSLDRAYAELSALVKPERDAIPSMRPPSGRRVGPTVTVSWLLRDSEVWRVDRIYYEAPGGPWIATEVRIEGVDDDSQTEWHTSSDADRLVRVLEELGVIGPASEVVSEGADAAATGRPAEAPQPAADPDSPWPWALGGLLAGVLLVLAGVGMARWRRDGDREPRQQLIDL